MRCFVSIVLRNFFSKNESTLHFIQRSIFTLQYLFFIYDSILRYHVLRYFAFKKAFQSTFAIIQILTTHTENVGAVFFSLFQCVCAKPGCNLLEVLFFTLFYNILFVQCLCSSCFNSWQRILGCFILFYLFHVQFRYAVVRGRCRKQLFFLSTIFNIDIAFQCIAVLLQSLFWGEKGIKENKTKKKTLVRRRMFISLLQ